MGWVLQADEKYFIQVFNDETIESYEVPICPTLVVTLTNGTYNSTYEPNDKEETVLNSFYRLNTDIGNKLRRTGS